MNTGICKRYRLAGLLTGLICFVAAGCSQKQFDLEAAIAAAPANARLIVPAGVYEIGDIAIDKDLRLIGRGAVVFVAPGPTRKGLLVPVDGASLYVQNIVFRGATAPDLNGAGIRHEGHHLTVVNCRFEDNENGILATGDADGEVIIRGSVFKRSGHGDGYSHGIYLATGASLTMHNSTFMGTRIGHHVKSLAARTNVEFSRFEDGDGAPSYVLDVSKGGDVSFTDNLIIRSDTTSNNTLINYETGAGGQALGIELRRNEIINHHPKATLLRNLTPVVPILLNNEIVNIGEADITLTGPGPTEALLQTPPARDARFSEDQDTITPPLR